MEITEYKNIFENESTHFFYVTTHNLVISFVKTYSGVKNLKILDAGCGTGLLAKKLQKYGTVTGIDMSDYALKFAKKRGIAVKKSSIEKLPFKNNGFDVVVSIDVLTHESIRNDLIPLLEFYKVMKPGGILILRVSAIDWLKSAHDIHVHMRQRYGREQLKRKIKKAKFIVEKLSFVNMTLVPLAIINLVLEKIFPPKNSKSIIGKVNPILNNTLIDILSIESKLLSFINLPFGIGLIAICRKPLSDEISPSIKSSKKNS